MAPLAEPYTLPAPADEEKDDDTAKNEIVINRELKSALLDLGSEAPTSAGRKATLHHFFINMALCNTVVVTAKPHSDKMTASGLYLNETGRLTSTEPMTAKISPQLPHYLHQVHYSSI